MAMKCTKKLTFVMIVLIILIIIKVQVNYHVSTILHPSPLQIHHSHPSQLDTNDHVALLNCIERRLKHCHETREIKPHFFEHLLCIEYSFGTCLGEEKDDPMYIEVESWLSTCSEKKRIRRTPLVAICLLKHLVNFINYLDDLQY